MVRRAFERLMVIQKFINLRTACAKNPKTVASLCAIVAACSLLEIYCYKTHGTYTAPESFAIDFHTFWTNLPNSTSTRIDDNLQPFTYCYNAQGFRRNDPSIPIPLMKKEGIRRVVAMGDSTTNGLGVPFDCMYPEILNQLFGGEVEVFSSGVPGFTAVQCRLQLEHKILPYKPDLITVAVNYNDRRCIIDGSQLDSEEYFYYTSRLRWITETLAGSIAGINALLQYRIHSLEKQFHHKTPRLDELSCRVPPEVFARNLEMICDIAQQRHIQTVLIGLGDSFQYFDGIFAYRDAISFEEKVQYLLRERDKKEFYSYGLASLLLAELLKREGARDTGLDPNQILTSYQPVLSALGGFLIHPDWTYRDIMKTVADKKKILYFDFVEYARSSKDIHEGATVIYVKKDPVHLNAKGHQLLAEALYPILKRRLSQ